MNDRIGCFEAAWLFIWNIIKGSGVYRLLKGIYDKISSAWRESRIANWFRVLHTYEDALEKTAAGRIIRAPFTFLEWIQRRFGRSLSAAAERSALLNLCRVYIDNLLALNLRFMGILGLSAAAGVAVARLCTGQAVGYIIWTLAAVCAVLSIFNVSITRYFKGSALVRLGCNLLDISPDFDWFDNESTEGGARLILAAACGVAAGALGGAFHIILMPLAIVGAAAVILIVRHPLVGVFALVAAAPLAPTMADVGLALLCIFSLALFAVRTEGFKFKFDGIGFFLIIFLGIYAVSGVTSFTPIKSISIWAIYFVFMTMYFVVINTVTEKRQLKNLLTAFVLSGLLVCLYGLAQYVFGWDTAQAWVDEAMFTDIKMRIYSTLGNPNVLGEYILLVLPAAIGLMWTAKGVPAKVCYAAISVVMLGAMVLTFSRGCWLGLLAAAAVFITFAAGKLWGLALIALPVLPMILPESIINRFSSIGDMDDSSTSYRVYIWLGTLAMMKDFWLSGIGMGQQAFTAVYPFYSYNGVVAPHSHNLFLQILVESGITGIAVFLIIAVLFLRHITVGYQAGGKGSTLSTLMTALSAGVCGFLLQGMFDNCFYNYRVMLVFWCVIAMGRACVYIANREKKEGSAL